SQVNDKHVLTMGGSGTSGILRFRSGDQYFIVALGVHNYKRWVDVSTSLAGNDTATHIHPDYYTGGNLRAGVREEQRKDFDVTPQSGPMAGRRVEVHYTISEGNNLEANVIIH
ncbi:fungal fruit body lectin, partial [Exidia glandulosa HHB12029]